MKHVKKHNYTDLQLVRALFADLRNDGMLEDAMILFRNRHMVIFDRYGWPTCL